MTLEPIHVPKSYSGTMNFVTSLKSLSGLRTQKMTYIGKLDWPQSWVHGKAHSLTSNILASSGRKIVQKKDC